ncbi:MAG: DUF3604 domain-containing protein [Proteobacteria bacterium]|nr:DUF3604 domain-containing protein [Pseudomonadota bacterium]
MNRPLILVMAMLLASCSEREPVESAPQRAVTEPPAVPAVIAQNPHRDLFFGDLHVHTSWSTDAFSGGNRVPPADAYRFARGEAITLPTGMRAQLAVPLDFVALTDHAEGFDAIEACLFEAHPQYETPFCQGMRNPSGGQAAYLKAAFARGTARPAQRSPGLCDDEAQCLANARSTWQRVQRVANEFDDPGEFTALIGYEFSALLPEFGMLHRNVIFRGDAVVPHAISSADVRNQADFFEQLDEACEGECAVLTIPHNTNYSWGLTFSRTDEDGSKYSSVDLERRIRIERLVEVTQMKGTSECQLGVGASDEDCDYGNLFPACQDDTSSGCIRPASMIRDTLLDGLALSAAGKPNPFKLGMIGSTDTHNSDPGNTSAERSSRNGHVMGDPQGVQRALDFVHPVAGTFRLMNEGGLAAVWATSNTRTDIFDALQRREAFATSGTRLRIRFFGGDLPEDIGTRSDALERADETGVPMGGELSHTQAKRFWVTAMQDVNGATLDRIQVVRGWTENGETQAEVRDIACSDGREPVNGSCPATGASVDLSSCLRNDGMGAQTLTAVFEGDNTNPSAHAFYYVRVLENPSCHWTTWLANSAGVELPEDVKPTVQHRAWSSPIFVNPAVR